jgi:Cell division protein
MDYDIIMEGEENGIQILDTERPSLEMEEIENLSYDLKRLPSKGRAKLPFHEVWRLAMSNILLMGKKQIFITIVLVAAAIMLSITAARYSNLVSIDEEKIVSTDSHITRIDFNNISVFNHSDHLEVLNFTKDYLYDNKYGYTFFAPEGSLYIAGEGFEQIKNLKQVINNVSYVPIDCLNKDSLIYGKMPEKRNETVIDLQVINNLMQSKGVVTTSIKKPEDFIGAVLKTSSYKINLKITGISNNHEPAIYCGQNILLGFPQKGYRIANLDELKKEDNKTYGSLQLADNEILIRNGLYNSLKLESNTDYRIGDDAENTYNIAGTFPDDIGVDYILSDKGCLNIRDLMIYQYKTCMIYSENPEKTIQDLKEIDASRNSVFKMKLTIPHNEELKAYIKANKGNTNASSLITIVIVVISVIMVYFTIKSNAISRSEELTVYSLLGISKKSILQSYIIEMSLLTSYTSLPAVLVTSVVIKFIGSIPSLGINMIFPWWAVLLLIAVIYIAHAVISIIPVYKILSKPPATLAVKG